jgi:hypothetical protein
VDFDLVVAELSAFFSVCLVAEEWEATAELSAGF